MGAGVSGNMEGASRNTTGVLENWARVFWNARELTLTRWEDGKSAEFMLVRCDVELVTDEKNRLLNIGQHQSTLPEDYYAMVQRPRVHEARPRGRARARDAGIPLMDASPLVD